MPNSRFPDRNPLPAAVLFDLGGVFIDVRVEDGLSAFRSLRPELGREQIRSVLLDDGLLGRYERGRIGSRAFHAEAVRRLGAPVSFPDFVRCWGAMLAAPDRRMTGFLRRLDGRALRVALSNTNEIHIRCIGQKYRLLGHFDRRIYSYACGCAKPEPGIFRKALDAAAAEPAACLFVDDRAENVRAARRMGIPSVRFTGSGAFFRFWEERFGRV